MVGNLETFCLDKMDGMAAFMQGKLQLKGDLNLAMKLTILFKMK